MYSRIEIINFVVNVGTSSFLILGLSKLWNTIFEYDFCKLCHSYVFFFFTFEILFLFFKINRVMEIHVLLFLLNREFLI